MKRPPLVSRTEDVLCHLSERHRAALQWFVNTAGTEQSWPAPLCDGTLLATRAKGIYKPHWTEYALSVREVLKGPYPDRAPNIEPDGGWTYRYFQENRDPSGRDAEYTNRALMACQRDGVPVGVMRQVSGKPQVRYLILGIARVVGWQDGYFTLEGVQRQDETP